MSLPSAFSLYDTTGFYGKPNLSRYGIKPMWIFYENATLVSGSDAQLLAVFEAATISHPDQPWILDIENALPIQIGGVVQTANVQRLIHVLQVAKSASLGQPVSYFGLLPDHDHPGIDTDPDILTLAATQDFFATDFYTRIGDDQVAWAGKSDALISRANVMAPGSPMIPFLWMEYFDPGPDNGTTDLGANLWEFEINYCLQATQGAILWGGYDLQAAHPLSSPLPWDNNALWWLVLKNIIGFNEVFIGNTLLTIAGCV